jgi:hypothetical protein
MCAIAALLLLSGCGENPRANDAAREGLPEKVGEIDYNVYITRELNLKDIGDSEYYTGPEAPPGFALYGVFLQACNNESEPGSEPVPAATDFTIVDTQGNRFGPRQVQDENPFAYHARGLGHEACIPRTGSLASSGPTAGALLVFQLPLSALENRPLNLEIVSPPHPETGERETGRVELDV